MVWNTSSGDALKIANIVVTIPSLLGSSAMIYFTLKAISSKPRKICNKIILCIAISDFLVSITNALSLFEPLTEVSTLCKIEGFLRIWSYRPTLFFVASLSILCVKGNIVNQSRFLCCMLTFIFIYCLIFSLL